MIKNKKIIALFAFLALTFTLVACNNQKNTLSPLRAVPITASGSINQRILCSYSSNDQNRFLIRVGHINNTLTNILSEHRFSGHEINITASIVTNESITRSMTETVTSSITVTNSHQHTVGVNAGWQGASFSANISYEWTGTWSNSAENSNSLSTSVSQINETIQSRQYNYTIRSGNSLGTYRLALYSTSDVFFVVTTTRNNQVLIEIETIMIPRNNLVSALEFSTDGTFDNSPIGNLIDFPQTFYRNLPVPTIEESRFNVDVYQTSILRVRDNQLRITDEGTQGGRQTDVNQIGWLQQYYDKVYFSSFGDLNISNMRNRYGFRIVDFRIIIEMREEHSGYQWVGVFRSSQQFINGNIVGWHRYSRLNNRWVERTFSFNNVSTDNFNYAYFLIRYGADGALRDDWYNRNIRVQITFRR